MQEAARSSTVPYKWPFNAGDNNLSVPCCYGQIGEGLVTN